MVAQHGASTRSIRGEDAGQLLLKFQNGATAFWDANRYNESEAESPRFTFGELRIDGTGGHLTMDASSTIRVKRLGEPVTELDYARERKNFAGGLRVFPAAAFRRLHAVRAGVRDEWRGLPDDRDCRSRLRVGATGQVVRLETSQGR